MPIPSNIQTVLDPSITGRPDDLLRQLRSRMVDEQIAARGIQNPRVLEAFRSVPRESFVPEGIRQSAYDDRALPVGQGQTISQPYIVALMTEALGIEPQHRVLEIGTGSGYQAAILALLAGTVYTIERLPDLSRQAQVLLNALGCTNIRFRVSDGSIGWPEEAPFDRIMVTAAAPELITDLVDQLADGGCLVAPIGNEPDQRLTKIEKVKGRLIERPMIGVRFVRLIGARGYSE